MITHHVLLLEGPAVEELDVELRELAPDEVRQDSQLGLLELGGVVAGGGAFPERVVDEAHQQLGRVGGSDEGEAGTRDGALLVEGAVLHGVGWRADVVAEVAPQPVAMLVRVVHQRGDALSDDQERVEPQGHGEAHLRTVGYPHPLPSGTCSRASWAATSPPSSRSGGTPRRAPPPAGP